MCGVFYVDDSTLSSVRKIVQSVDPGIDSIRFFKDIHPTDMALVMVGDNGKLKLACQRWGYPGIQGNGVIFNARAESVRGKKLFSGGISYHRAVIPAKQFYEWNPNREKYTFCRRDGQSMFLAGFYGMMENGERFVILTTQANESMKKIHDRMPLVLETDQLENWICDDAGTGAILKQVPVLLDSQAEYEQMTLF